MNQYVIFLAGLFILEACGNGSHAQQNSPNNMSQLLEKINAAVKENIPICEMDAFTGEKSIVNTCSENDRPVVQMANIEADSDHPGDFPDLRDARDVVYWLVGHEPKYTRIDGICWPMEGEPAIFHGRVFPP